MKKINVLIDEEKLNKRIKEMSQQISREYKGVSLLYRVKTPIFSSFLISDENLVIV